MAAHFTDADFPTEVLRSEIPVLVDFFAEWCGPCKMMSPAIEKLAKEFDGKVKIGKLDIDANNKTAEEYMIRSIPTLIVFKKGQAVEQIIGFKSEEALRTVLMKYSA